jgi:uncharacterized repeat protein (TIGR01451 family)
MERLSVRLSIVGAVLVLGSAAIAHSIWSKGTVSDETAQVEPTETDRAAKAADQSPPQPIPADESETEIPQSVAIGPPTEVASRIGDTADDQSPADPYGMAQPSPRGYGMPVGDFAGRASGTAVPDAGSPDNLATDSPPQQDQQDLPTDPTATAYGTSYPTSSYATPNDAYGEPRDGSEADNVTDDSQLPARASFGSMGGSVYSPPAEQFTATSGTPIDPTEGVSSSAAAEESLSATISDNRSPSAASTGDTLGDSTDQPTGVGRGYATNTLEDGTDRDSIAADVPNGVTASISEGGTGEPTAGDAAANSDSESTQDTYSSSTTGSATRATSSEPSTWRGTSSSAIPSDGYASNSLTDRSRANAADASSSQQPNTPSMLEPNGNTANPAAIPVADTTAETSSSDAQSRYADSAATQSRMNDVAPQPSNEMPSQEMPSNGYGASAPSPLGHSASPSLDASMPSAAANSGTSVRSTASLPSQLSASNRPGQAQLEGQQTASLTLEKIAPEEVQVDREATFQLRVRNVGTAPAENVVVIDRVPQGTKFVSARPNCTPTAEGLLMWQLDTIAPGGESVLDVQLLPTAEGEIGSVASVSFQSKASVRSICTRPQLAVKCDAVPTVLLGESITLDITVVNNGSGAAADVVLQEDVPEGLNFHAGRAIDQRIGTLEPGESVRLSLDLDSVKKGVFQNRLTVLNEGRVHDELTTDIQVVAPALQVTLTGPTRRFLQRQATYALGVSNPGTAAARDVELIAYLPRGMKYVTSDNQGQYDEQSHAVYWALEELPAGNQGDAHVTVTPVEPGDQKLRAEGRAAGDLHSTCEHSVLVEGLPELEFTVKDVADPIEVGSRTQYEIRVINQGTQQDSNVQVAAALPPDVQLIDGSGPTQATIQGQQIRFAPLATLAPQEEAVFVLHAQGKIAGHHVIRVQLQSDGLAVPVTKEESTRVYADR